MFELTWTCAVISLVLGVSAPGSTPGGAPGGEASVALVADAVRVWSLVSDVTRMGAWSPELEAAAWLDGATGPAVGARFKGRTGGGGPVEHHLRGGGGRAGPLAALHGGGTAAS